MHSNEIGTIYIDKLKSIQKLGAFFRGYFNDWKLVVVNTAWRSEDEHFVREVQHVGAGQVLAYAQTIVPIETFTHFRSELEHLGERSIGDDFLFLKTDLKRGPFEFFNAELGLARRSTFIVEGYSLVITEYFTPAGLKCLLNA